MTDMAIMPNRAAGYIVLESDWDELTNNFLAMIPYTAENQIAVSQGANGLAPMITAYRRVPAVVTFHATPTPNSDTTYLYAMTALSAATALQIPAGTPTWGRILGYAFKDDGTARAITYNGIFRAIGSALPSTTVISKWLYIWFMYNATDSKWDLVGKALQP